MNKTVLKIIFCLSLIASLSCKKDSKSLDDMILDDGMIVFRLDGKDWIIKNMIASYSDLTGVAGGELISLYGSVPDTLGIYKTIVLLVMDTLTINNKDYPFTGTITTGSNIEIDEGKTQTAGARYRTTNPDDTITGTGKIIIANYDRMGNTISGSFSGDIFKTNYTGNTNTVWVKTSIKSGRFSNVQVIIGK